jgi:lauroyl/myristoyl acyltransferase
MRRQSRLHLLYLLDLQSSPTVLPSLLSIPVETMASPSKIHQRSFYKILPVRCIFGGDGGSRTHVQKSFALKELQQYTNYTPQFLARQIRCYIYSYIQVLTYENHQSSYHVSR